MQSKLNKKKLRVGVIGVGAMGRNHIRVYKNLDKVELVAVSDVDKKSLDYIKERYNLKTYTDYRQMLENGKLDIISVAVPTKLHFKVANDVIEKGVNLLIEKPIASTTKEGREIIKLAKIKCIHLGVGHTERFNPVVATVKKYLDDNKLGRVFQIMIRRIGPFPPRVRDVGVFLDLATHDLDVMCYLVGSEIKTLSAESGRLVHSKHEDLAASLLRFNNGIIGILVENWLSPTKIRDIYINGEKGMFLADFIAQDLYFYENNYTSSPWDSLQVFRGMAEGNMTRYYITRDEPLRLELEAFVNSVLYNKPFLVSGEDGLRAVELAERLAKDSNTKNKL